MTFKLFIVSLVTFCALANAEEKRPNIIIFLVDDLGWADISLRGAPIDTQVWCIGHCLLIASSLLRMATLGSASEPSRGS